jgi:hypothetical protein
MVKEQITNTGVFPLIAIMVHPPGNENVHLETAQEVDELLRSNGIQP